MAEYSPQGAVKIARVAVRGLDGFMPDLSTPYPAKIGPPGFVDLKLQIGPRLPDELIDHDRPQARETGVRVSVEHIAGVIRLHPPFPLWRLNVMVIKMQILRARVLLARFKHIGGVVRVPSGLPVTPRKSELETQIRSRRQLPVESAVGKDSLGRLEIFPIIAITRRTAHDIALKAVSLLAGNSEPVAQLRVSPTVAQQHASHPLLAHLGRHQRAGHLGSCFGDDVDDGRKCVCTVDCGIGATNHLDALDIFNGQGQVAPVHRAVVRTVDGASVDQYLKASRIGIAQTVIARCPGVVAGISHGKSRHQPQQIGNIAKPGSPDHVLINHRDRSRCFVDRLGQARNRQHDRQIVEKISLGHLRGECIAGAAACQQG